MRQLLAIVESVTSSPSECPVSRDIQCRRRPRRQRCTGMIQAGFKAGESTIRWGCPVCSDSGWISGWHGTRWGRGGWGSLPEIRWIAYRHGMVRRLGEIDCLPCMEHVGSDITREMIVAIHDNALIGASGEYGDPRVGEPLQYDELHIDHGTGSDRIVVYNLGDYALHYE